MLIWDYLALQPALPEVVLALSAMVLLMLGAFKGDGHTRIISWFAVLVLGLTLILVLEGIGETHRSFGDTFIVDGFARFMKVLALIGSSFAVVMSLGYIEREEIALDVTNTRRPTPSRPPRCRHSREPGEGRMLIWDYLALQPALPEVVLALSAMVLLMLGAFKGDGHTRIISWFAVLVLGLTLILVLEGIGETHRSFGDTFIVEARCGRSTPGCRTPIPRRRPPARSSSPRFC